MASALSRVSVESLMASIAGGVRLLHEVVDCAELVLESQWEQEGPEVEAVVVRRIILGVIRWGQSRHLVPVQSVVEVEVLHLLRHLFLERRGLGLHADRRGNSRVVISRAVPLPGLVRPLRPQLEVRRQGATMLDLPAMAQVSELVVRHAHVLFVRLRLHRLTVLCELVRPQFRCRVRVGHAVEHRHVAVNRRPLQKLLQVTLVDASDGIDVRRAAIILCVITA
mmetsp:Transcript_86554/g.242413  ORF Transcript_86554/g.242413 Transcript_86554/m.242413 type:complete len:224 (-) Transcript_86554:1764-2435(-)